MLMMFIFIFIYSFNFFFERGGEVGHYNRRSVSFEPHQAICIYRSVYKLIFIALSFCMHHAEQKE